MSQYAATIVQTTGRTFAGDVSGDPRGPWVRLEQVMPDRIFRGVNVAQLHAMWMRSASGSSAALANIMGCPVEIRGSAVHVFLGFYAWPFSPDLEFELYASQGDITRRTRIFEHRSFSKFVNNSRQVLLPYYMEHASAFWLTPVYSREGEVIPAPTITNHNTWLELSREAFGVLRISGTAFGESAVVEIILDRELEVIDTPIAAATSWYDAPDNVRIYTPAPAQMLNAVKISNVQTTVTAVWEGEYGTETTQLALEIPPCVQDLLELCPDMFQRILRICDRRYTLYVHFNLCTGEILDITPDDPISYCSQSNVTGPADYLLSGSRWLR